MGHSPFKGGHFSAGINHGVFFFFAEVERQTKIGQSSIWVNYNDLTVLPNPGIWNHGFYREIIPKWAGETEEKWPNYSGQ